MFTALSPRDPAPFAHLPTRHFAPLALAAGLMIVSIPASSRADFLVIPSPQGGSNGWMVTWSPNDKTNTVDMSFSAVTRILTATVTFNSLNPVTITFDEVAPAPAADSALAGGVNVVMQENITNNSNSTWVSFTLFLDDKTVINPADVQNGGAGSAHPVFPHFHPVTTPMFAPFGKFSGFDAQPAIFLSNGPFPSGPAQFLWQDFRVHDREVAGKLRSFQLIEQPTTAPEPGSLLLVAIGALGLFASTSRRNEAPR